MSSRLIILLSLMLLLCLPEKELLAQDLALRGALFTEAGTHPGIMLGVTRTLKSWDATKVNQSKQTPKSASLVLIPQVGMYSHRQNHTGLLTQLDIGIRRQKQEKKHYHLGSIGVGSLTQFNSGTTYLLGDDGAVEEQKHASRTYLHTTLAYELGQARNESINWYLRFQIGAKLPYNTYFSLVPIIQIGVNYQLSKSTEDEQ